jgi:hypothetical protein
MIATVDHAHHRLRRSPIASFFSKTNVRKLDYVLHSHVSKLRLRLKEYEASGEPFNIINAYKSLASDVVTTYAFGQNNNYLETPDFNAPFWKMFHDLSFDGTANDHLPWILPMVMSMPDWYVSREHFVFQFGNVSRGCFFDASSHFKPFSLETAPLETCLRSNNSNCTIEEVIINFPLMDRVHTAMGMEYIVVWRNVSFSPCLI